MKKRRREEELRREIAKATDVAKQLDLVNELGALYRCHGDFGAARDSYRRAVQIATSLRNHLDLSFAHRALAEISAEEGNRNEALEQALRFRQTAQESGSYSQVQLSLHVTGWVYEKLNMQQSHDPADLEEALSWCLKSLDYIKKFGHRIDADRKAVSVGGDSARRKAGLERLCSGICANLHRRNEAESYWNAAYSYAKRTHDVDVEYELLLARIDFSWESPLKNAQRLVNFAPAKKKGYALVELAQVLMFSGDFLGAQNALFECLLHHRSSLMAEDAELLDARVVFLYKYFYRLERSKDPDCDRRERRRMYELIADSFCSYGGERKEMFEHALKFYKLMFQESIMDKEKFTASISVAQTFMDMEAFDEAVEWFEKALSFEKKLGRPEIKLCQTRVLIFVAKSRRTNACRSALLSEFESLNADIPVGWPHLKATLHEAMGRFLFSRGGEGASDFLDKAERLGNEPDPEESDDDDSEEICDDLEARPDRAILNECVEMARRRDSDREIVKDRDKEKNAHGETRLHIAARSNDTAMVEKLIAAGYDVNRRDHGGWTPISEAVTAGMRDNVRALLKAGAKVDPVSKEALNDDENSTGGGITPLMEACDKGFIDIAKDLLKYGASVVKKNADGWTAVDFLRNLIVSCDKEDEALVAELTSLAVFMEDQQRKLSFPVRGCAPQRQHSGTRSKPSTIPVRSKPLRNREETIDLSGYKRVIGGLGAQSKKSGSKLRVHDESSLFDDNDILDADSPLEDEVSLPSDCEDGAGSSQQEATTGITLLSSSQLSSPLNKRRNSSSSRINDFKDDFLVNDLDESRRRKRRMRESSSILTENPKRRSSFLSSVASSQPPSPIRDRSPSPEVIIRRSQTRSTRNLSSSRHSSPSFVCSPMATPSRNPNPSVGGVHIVATLKFEDADGGVLRSDKLVSFPRSATMATAEERFRSELSSYQAKSFDIRLFDGREADPEVPLLSLGEGLVIVARLRNTTVGALGKKRPGHAQYQNDLSNYVAKVKATGVLDLSCAEVERQGLVEDVLRNVSESKCSVRSLIMDGCDLSGELLALIGMVLPNVERYSHKYAGFRDDHIQQMNLTTSPLPIRSIDLSHNEFTSGLDLSRSLLASCCQLSELRISDLEISSETEALISSICGLQHLRVLDVSFNGFFRGTIAEHLLSSCENLSTLRMDGCDLSGVAFVSTWLPNLRELSMSGCRLTDFDSLIEWMSMGCVQQLDLSATDIGLDHIRTMVESRLMCPTITIRLVKCHEIERDPRAFVDMILAFVDDRSFPLRFGFSSHFIAALQAITAFASNFLI